jgi:type IV secretory pathway TrbL component
MLVLKRVSYKKWALIGSLLGVLMLVALFLSGCSTTQGVIDGVESVGGGVLQDLQGAYDGINEAHGGREGGE